MFKLAVNTAKAAEIGLSMNMQLLEYSKNKNYIDRTGGGSLPLRFQ